MNKSQSMDSFTCGKGNGLSRYKQGDLLLWILETGSERDDVLIPLHHLELFLDSSTSEKSGF